MVVGGTAGTLWHVDSFMYVRFGRCVMVLLWEGCDITV